MTESNRKAARPFRVDMLQYPRMSTQVIEQYSQSGLDIVHITLGYHETFQEVVHTMCDWNRRFASADSSLLKARSRADLYQARALNKTAVLLGLQNSVALDHNSAQVEILYDLGLRFMQLTYNTQSLLGAGCMEPVDSGVTLMGKQVIQEMNRVNMIIDLSHAAERTALETIALSTRPVSLTHANPKDWHDCARNVSHTLIGELVNNAGVMGFSLYPHHMPADVNLQRFCTMVAELVSRYGVEHFGIGSDLCTAQPPSSLAWMRQGRWSLKPLEATLAFPKQPDFFPDTRGFDQLESGLLAVGLNPQEVAAILGENWLRFLNHALA